MHIIQEKILKLADKKNLSGLTLRKIGELIDESGSPQKIKHHLNKLMGKGLIAMSADGKRISKISSGVNKETKLISLPIYGKVNCGQALEFAVNQVEGYLKISGNLLDKKLTKKINGLFVLKAVGSSMNRASIDGKNIVDGDYVIVDKKYRQPKNGDYVVSIIDGAANIKKIYFNKDKQIALISESTLDLPPIYIHQNDYKNYFVCGIVVAVMKRPDEFLDFVNAAATDVLKSLGPISKREVEYYENL